jgi:DNA-binding response OmpR family regulator
MDVLHPRSILIVENEPDLATTCARLFRQMGHVPILASDGREALSLIDRHQPDLVLTDHRLPGVDGLEVLRRARSDAKTPVILVTTYASETVRREVLAAGAVYLPKPFSLADLRAAVEAALAGGL